MTRPADDLNSAPSRNFLSFTEKCGTNFHLFYTIGILMTLANLTPFLAASQEYLRVDSEGPQDWQMICFFSTSFILSVPLALEFCMDLLVGKLYPAYSRSVVEHKTGHFLILLSLAAPIVLVVGSLRESMSNPFFEKCFINACQCLAFVAIFGTLQVTDKDTWKWCNSMAIISLFFGSQIVLNFSIDPTPHGTWRSCHLDLIGGSISLTLLLLTLILHVVESRKFLMSVYSLGMDVVRGAGWKSGSFNSDQFTSTILVTMVLVFLLVRSALTAYGILYWSRFNLPDATANTLLTNVIFALVAVALPGRMIRRGMVALKHEMENKKTFIRYISHEIRSPLSTTSLGLDYLIDQVSAATSVGRSLDPETVLEVVKDARVSCELATNTLNDLLMFDKIETGMLELSAVECDAWEFVTSCVKPFQLQAFCAGVAIHTTQKQQQTERKASLPLNDWQVSEDRAGFVDLEAQQTDQPHLTDCSHQAGGFHGLDSLCLVQVDRYKMEQVVRNFLTNALKFTPQHCDGSIAVNMCVLPTVTANNCDSKNCPSAASHKYKAQGTTCNSAPSLWSRGSRAVAPDIEEGRAEDDEVAAVLRVEVVDTGAGISAENLPKLFGQYVQFDANTLQGGKGSGLGLWLSKAIVEMHGGVIGATSEGAGQGCTFYFELPCRLRSRDCTSAVADHTAVTNLAFTPSNTTTPRKQLEGALDLESKEDDPSDVPSSTKIQSHLTKAAQNVDSAEGYLGGENRNANDVTVNINSGTDVSGHNNHISTIRSSDITAVHRFPPSGQRQEKQQQQQQQRISKATVTSRAQHYRGLLAASGSGKSSDIVNVPAAERGDRYSTGGSIRRGSHGNVSYSSRGSVGTGQHTLNCPQGLQQLVGLRVLLVDDSALARKMVERSLLTAQCSVHHAQNGLEGVQKVQQSLQPGETPYDVVVIDCYMPVMNGPEAVAIMRGPECGFKGMIFAVTGAATNEEFTVGGESADLGVDCVMVKPFSLEKFSKTICELKSGH